MATGFHEWAFESAGTNPLGWQQSAKDRKIKIDNGEAQELNRFLMLVGEHLTKGLGV